MNLQTIREDRRDDEWVEVLSWKPRVFLYHNFLTVEDAEHVIELAGRKIERSQVSLSGSRAVTFVLPSVTLNLRGRRRKENSVCREFVGTCIDSSKVVANSGGSVTSSVRTSSGVFIMGEDREDPVVQVGL